MGSWSQSYSRQTALRIHKMFVIKLVWLLLTCVKIITAGDLCQTPNSQKGECKPINDCPVLYKLLEHRPVSISNADYLKKSQCGFAGSRPKVCCPIGSDAPLISGSSSTNSSVESEHNKVLPSRDECGLDNNSKIFGGEKTEFDEFPWMAVLAYEKPGGTRGFHCGGVLITKRYVLTAAHCIKGTDLPKTWNLTSVRLGECDFKSNPDCTPYECAEPIIDINIEQQIPHEQYNPNDINRYHDIALLRLIRDVEFTGFIRPICLYTTTEELRKSYIGLKIIIAGWGKTETGSFSDTRLKARVEGKELKECKTTSGDNEVELKEGQLCVGGETEKDLCRGDSGGPLMTVSFDGNHVNWFVVGLVSFAPFSCDVRNSTGVYTEVSKYTPWILNKLKA